MSSFGLSLFSENRGVALLWWMGRVQENVISTHNPSPRVCKPHWNNVQFTEVFFEVRKYKLIYYAVLAEKTDLADLVQLPAKLSSVFTKNDQAKLSSSLYFF